MMGQSGFPAPPAHEPADLTLRGPLPKAGGVAVLELDQGSVLRLDRTWVVGRDPVAPSGRPDAIPFAVADAGKSISKTHLAVGPMDQGAWVVDLHSTNGVTVNQPGATPQLLVPGEPSVVAIGTVIVYGDRTMVIR